MAVLRCATCGAKVKSEEGKFTATCEYCGNEMTIFESTTEFDIDSKGKLVQYNGTGGDIVVPEEVRVIGAKCFCNNERIFNVVLPGSVTKICESAFEGCTELESINLPDSLESIEEYAFSKCSSMKEISVPDGIISLKDSTFCDCSSLNKAILPDSVRNFGRNVFSGCVKLESINLPANLRYIGKFSFEKCSRLRLIQFGEKIEFVGEFAFTECSSIESIVLPNSVLEIGEYAFCNCSSLKHFSLGTNVSKLGKNIFRGCHLLEGTIVIPNSVITMNWYGMFDNCPNISEIIVGSGIKTISDMNVFPNLKKVVLSEGLEEICHYAFNSCIKLEEIKIPSTVKNIGEFAFFKCPLKKVKLCYDCNINMGSGAFPWLDNPSFEYYPSLSDREKYDHTISDIIGRLKKAVTFDSSESLYKSRNAIQSEIESLKKTFQSFDGIIGSISESTKEKSNLLSQKESLMKKRDSLGLFSGKEKKRIDEECEKIDIRITAIGRRIKELTSKLGGYQTKKEISSNIQAAEKEYETVCGRITIAKDVEQIPQILNSNAYIKEEVFRQYPSCVNFPVINACYQENKKITESTKSTSSDSSPQSSSSYSLGGYSSSYGSSNEERTFTQGGPTGCGIGGSFCGCGSGR